MQKVDELKLNNEYQLRQKDTRYKQRIKDVTDKFKIELDTGKEKYDTLLDEKRQMELAYEEKLKSLHQTHSAEFKEREAQYGSKIEQEQRRRQQLQAERKTQNLEWDAMNSNIVEEHTLELNTLTTGKFAAQQRLPHDARTTPVNARQRPSTPVNARQRRHRTNPPTHQPTNPPTHPRLRGQDDLGATRPI